MGDGVVTPGQKLGARIREVRQAHGLSQRELGRRVGISHVAVSYVERGFNGCTMDRLACYAKALGVPPSHLLCVLDEVRS